MFEHLEEDIYTVWGKSEPESVISTLNTATTKNILSLGMTLNMVPIASALNIDLTDDALVFWGRGGWEGMHWHAGVMIKI